MSAKDLKQVGCALTAPLGVMYDQSCGDCQYVRMAILMALQEAERAVGGGPTDYKRPKARIRAIADKLKADNAG